MPLERDEKIKVHIPEGHELPQDTEDAHCTHDPVNTPDMCDHQEEKLEARLKLGSGEGVVILQVAPGTALGEMYVSVQYEGPPSKDGKDRERCLTGHNEIAEHVNAWLQDLFGDAAAKLKVTIDTSPCPKVADPRRIVEPYRSLGRERQASAQVEAKRQVRREQRRSV